MKKKISILLVALLFLPCIFIFSACGEKKYDIRFMVNNSVYYTIQSSGNEEITLPSDPNITGYDFDGWYFDKGIWQNEVTRDSFKNTKLTSNKYIYAKLVAKKYTITWKNYDGTILEVDEDATYKSTPSYDSDTPKKDGNVQYKYTFKGWSPSVSKVIENQTYIAQFTQEINKYTISWLSDDGSLIKTTNVEYGCIPSFSGTPTKESEGKYYYTFKKWEPDLTTVVGNAQYKAIFENHESTEFKINYNANGGIGAPNTQTKNKNVDLILSNQQPTREGYQFVGWNNIYENKVYQAGDTFSIDLNLTLFAMWERNCLYCNGLGIINTEETCSHCHGNGSTTSTSTITCSTCDGDGYIYYSGSKCAVCSGSGKMSKVCSSCNGYGGYFLCKCSSGHSWYANNGSKYCPYCKQYMISGSRINTCSSCSGSGTVKSTCTTCSGSGRVGSKTYTCSSCGGKGKKTVTSTYDCSYCGGDGKIEKTITCIHCNGKKIVKLTAPTYESIESRKITLQQISGYEYSLDGTNWQSSNVFENLKPSTQYTFYQRLATNGSVPFGTTSEPLTITTKSSTLFYISYKLDGGVNNDNNPTQYYSNNSNVTLLSPTKEYFDFVGWEYKGNIVTEIKSSWAEDIELVATWTLHNYQISYELDGGTTTNPNSYNINTNDITLSDAIKKGYTFIGWTSENITTPQKNIVIAQGSSGDLTFVANWKANTYTLTFNTNGGSDIEQITQECDSVLKIPTPTNYGKSFAGWFDSNLENEINLERMPAEDMTLYAKWIDYNIEITSDDVKWMPITEDLTVEYLNASAIDTDGNKINVYIDIKDGTPKTKGDISFSVIATGLYDVSVKKEYNLHILDENESILYLYKNNEFIKTLRIYKGENYSLPKEELSNVAWFYNETKITNDDGTSLDVWDKNSGVYEVKTNYYTITYDANNGVVNNNTQLVNLGASAVLETPTRVGYQFDGWYYNDTLYTDGIWKTPNNITLVAKWIANTDTPYIVNHYQQNLENDEYVLFETENLTGTSDSTITPNVKTYNGFNSPKAQTTTISADGTRVINYYYTRVTYTLTIIKNDGNTEVKDVKYQANLANAITISREGFTLGGYFTDETLSEQITIMPSNNTTVYVWWQEETKPVYLTYSGSSSITISGYTGTDTRLQIPTYIGNKIVTTISSSSITNKETLTEIVVPDSVTSIGIGAFKGCNKLTSITLPFVGKNSSVSSSYTRTSDCSYKFGYIFGVTENREDGTIYDGRYCYYYIPQALRNVTITKATGISSYAFYGCNNLTSITLNKEITSIYERAFYNCSGLTGFTIPENTTTIGNYAFYGCSGISALTFNEKVTTIGDYAFYGCVKVTEIDLPETLTTIGAYAFYNTRLKTLTIPSKVNSIGEHAFEKNVALTELVIPGNVKTIGSYAFSDCTQISKLTLTNGITTIGDFAFQNLVVTEIVVPDSVTSIGIGAFKGCNKLTSITLPFVGNSKEVDADASCSYSKFGYIFGYETSNKTDTTYDGYDWYYYIPRTLRNVTITKATGISANAFYGCSYLTSVTLNKEVTVINSSAFYNCSGLTSFTVPENTTSIGSSAFYGCSGMESILLPYGLKTVGANVFSNCSKLNINCQIDEQPSDWNTDWNPSNCSVIWNYGCTKGITEDGFDWISLDGETVRIRGYSGNATELTIPNSIEGKPVTRIDANTFRDNSKITLIKIPNSVNFIETNAFYNLSNLLTVIIPNSVLTVQSNSFSSCLKVSFLCENNSKPIGWQSNWCSSTNAIAWDYANENGVTEDGFKWALRADDTIIIYGYNGTSDIITIPQTINEKTVCAISINAFRNNKTLTAVHISNSITFIGDYAFSGCSNSIIYCQPDSRPSGWSSSWIDSSMTVYWSM